ncbi:sensor histidine kinase [Hyphomonas sp.]|uniref:sensor histidine kinase n=1 Tax=Hyphomonas sp. TaxID=87 RepID=UPI000A9488D4|nr:sensor histidine kinase [Hyphomonas sp.]
MNEEIARGPAPLRMSLRWQVIGAMALALSPLLVLGAMRVSGEREEARQAKYQELVETSREGQSGVDTVLAGTRLALSLMAVDERKPTCTQISNRLSGLNLPFRNVFRFNAEGQVTCFFAGENLVGQPMPDLGWNDQLRRGMKTIESSRFDGLALGDPVIWMLQGVANDAGEFEGSVAVTVSIEQLAKSLPETASPGLRQGIVLVDGDVLGSGIVERIPVGWLTSEAILERTARQLRLPQGGRVDVVVMPLATDSLWILTPSSTPRNSRIETVVALTIPVLAFLAALLTATWIMDTLVLRWIERLRLRISDLRRSAEYTPLADDLARAPAELQQLARAFDDLTESVKVHESDLLQALARMKGAFRETHHRVKNNLQVMLSMLKLQGRSEVQPETQVALRLAAQRVAMMAAVHHSLLNESHIETVDASELFDAICKQIHERQGWEEESRHLVPDVEDVSLPSDLAVPMAMFVQEAFDHLCPATGDSGVIRDLSLEFRQENGHARLRMSCGREPTASDEATRSRDTNLFLAAFARQMGGAVEDLGDDPDNVIIELTFPIEQ